MKQSNLISDSVNQQASYRLQVGGQVQGVGFRPFVYRLATSLGLSGWVRNEGATVTIQVAGGVQQINTFTDRLIKDAPLIARPIILERSAIEMAKHAGFEIKSSATTSKQSIHLPVDYFICRDCLAELNDPNDRRYQYPFINCTQCGPRYTIIKSLPYDRANTTMVDFAMCPNCLVEYEDPNNRRFHAEPIACPECGPKLTYVSDSERVNDTGNAIEACVLAINSGQIVAIKGIGGYHLCCDALNPAAIQHLRVRKQRPDKPLAVMFAEQGDDGLKMIRQYLKVNRAEQHQILEPSRPIVLLEKIANKLPDNLAPQLNDIGAMLPYSPLHHILLENLGRPIVATSANISGEPVITDNEEAEIRLKNITTNFLHHDRPIQRPADDSLVRFNTHKPRRVRIGRGLTPIELTLPVKLSKPVLACGGQMKSAVALAWADRVIVSPHIGDLDSPRSQLIFEQVIEDLQRIYQVKVEQLVCDAHQGYSSTRWARQTQVPTSEIFHHYAHASVLAGEYPDVDNWLIFTWDGVGLGDDGSLWGGEGLYGGPGNWQRLTSWRPFYLPGGDKAARQPWRSAAALCWDAGLDFNEAPEDIKLLQQAWQKRVNTSKSSAVGRLFDAAASLTGICQQASFEGQAPMWLENAATRGRAEPIELPLVQNQQGLWQSDWQPLITYLQDSSRSEQDRARTFHDSVAKALVDQACVVREHHPEFTVGLCGGVFQNRLLTETVFQQLTDRDFRVLIPEKIPINDGGLCYGQVIEFAASC